MVRFAAGDSVTVRRAFSPGHVRTPYYIRGKSGHIERLLESPTPRSSPTGGTACPSGRFTGCVLSSPGCGRIMPARRAILLMWNYTNIGSRPGRKAHDLTFGRQRA
jgi:hypothetical protein